ncbi:hypothetical protein NJ76_28230 [Rhodococcus sp. IITR03]|nr:hypothetical protein NJ76_28230 [Rhodococcus sp. IITR03]
MVDPLLVAIVRCLECPLQGGGLFGSKLLRRVQSRSQRGAVVRVTGLLDCRAEFVLAAGCGVVQREGLRVVGFGDGQAVVQPRMIRILDQTGAGSVDAYGSLAEPGAHVWGAAWAGFGFTHRRPPAR